MIHLTEQNIEFIAEKINQSKIQSIEMKEDLIDHFCCAIEEEMQKGISFEKSYDKAYQNICPDGFDEIHRETVYLLTSTNIKVMKKLLYLSGCLTAIGITTTIGLKVTHTAGGSIALLTSFLLLVFLFLPSLFLHQYKRELHKTLTNKLIYLFSFFGILLLIASGLFKIMHWGQVTLLLISAMALLNFVIFPALFFKLYRKSI